MSPSPQPSEYPGKILLEKSPRWQEDGWGVGVVSAGRGALEIKGSRSF